MTATAVIKDVPSYKGYEFILVERLGVHLRCPDGELVRVGCYRGTQDTYFALGIMACTDLEKLFRAFVDQKEKYTASLAG